MFFPEKKKKDLRQGQAAGCCRSSCARGCQVLEDGALSWQLHHHCHHYHNNNSDDDDDDGDDRNGTVISIIDMVT